MVGLPGETIEDIKVTSANITRLSPSYVRIYPLVVLKNTPLCAMFEEGNFTPISFEEAVRRALFLYLNSMKHNIKIVKMGLTDNEIIKHKVIAGHYHPAFGYVVKSEALYLAVKAHLDFAHMTGNVVVSLNNRDIPHLLGDKRINIEKLRQQNVVIAWKEANVEEGTFILQKDSKKIAGNIYDGLCFYE
jgi:histone acetyltransferase (RNA polymerase elongator complex component)